MLCSYIYTVYIHITTIHLPTGMHVDNMYIYIYINMIYTNIRTYCGPIYIIVASPRSLPSNRRPSKQSNLSVDVPGTVPGSRRGACEVRMESLVASK